jgi:hypothetical protein
VNDTKSVSASQETSPSRALLEHFPASQRSGILGPRGIVAAVSREARQCGHHALVDALREHPEQALDFAQWCIAWERLPAAERQRVKSERAAAHRAAWMAQQEPTAKQLSYLKALGHRGEVTSRQHASQLIDGLLQRKRGASNVD